MDDVENLDIRIDHSDREYYYDFMHGAIVRDPEEAKGKVPADKGVKVGIIFKSDVHELRAAHITKAHYLDKRCFEKFAPSKDEQKSLKDDVFFGGDYTKWNEDPLPRYSLPIYNPGEVIRGTVVLTLKKKLEAEKLTLQLLGRATVNVRIYHRYGYYDNTEHEPYIDNSLVLWKAPGTKLEGEFTPLFSGEEKELNEGTYRFPFEFKIPETANASVIPLIGRSDHYAHISYRLKATVDRSKRFGRGNAVSERGVWIERRINAADLKEKQEPVSVEENLSTGLLWSSGDIKVKVTVPKSAFARHESVPVNVEIENNSGGKIDEVICKIKLEGRGKTGTKKLSCGHSFKHSTVAVKNGPIAQGECPSYDMNLPFDFSEAFPDSCMIPVSEASDLSKLIDFRYEVYVKVKRSGPHRNMEITLPITVCTENKGSLYPTLDNLSLQ